jgi:(p)ppGpp synthase/HD superfamily hydrolase
MSENRKRLRRGPMSTLTKEIVLVAKHHEGQKDKGGNPYIFHPIRLMLKGITEDEQIVAILHHTIEDTDLTLDDLRKEGYSSEIVEVVDSLSRRKNETYEEFIYRIKKDPLAQS